MSIPLHEQEQKLICAWTDRSELEAITLSFESPSTFLVGRSHSPRFPSGLKMFDSSKFQMPGIQTPHPCSPSEVTVVGPWRHCLLCQCRDDLSFPIWNSCVSY